MLLLCMACATIAWILTLSMTLSYPLTTAECLFWLILRLGYWLILCYDDLYYWIATCCYILAMIAFWSISNSIVLPTLMTPPPVLVNPIAVFLAAGWLPPPSDSLRTLNVFAHLLSSSFINCFLLLLYPLLLVCVANYEGSMTPLRVECEWLLF